MADVNVRKGHATTSWVERVADIGGGYHAPEMARASQVVEPDPQVTTAAFADVPGSEIDALHFSSVSYTILNTDGANSLDWQVLASNDAWATAVIVDGPGAVAAGVADSYAVAQAPYRYYIVQVQDTAAPNHATAVVVGLAKA